MTPDLAAVRARHVRQEDAEGIWCRHCGMAWPCDVTPLLAEIALLRPTEDREALSAERSRREGVGTTDGMTRQRLKDIIGSSTPGVAADRIIAELARVEGETRRDERAKVLAEQAAADEGVSERIRARARGGE